MIQIDLKKALPIFNLVATGDLNGLKALHERNKLHIYCRTPEGASLEHVAALYGQMEIIDWLYAEKGYVLEERDKEDRTPLMYAAQSGNLPLLQHLTTLCGEASLFQIDYDDSSVFTHAMRANHVSIVEWLTTVGQNRFSEEEENNFPALLDLALSGCFDMVKWLITRNKTLLQKQNSSGQTVMMYAIRGGYLNIAQWLYEMGGNALLWQADQNGNTPLLVLVSANADLEGCTLDDFDPDSDIADWLLEVGGVALFKQKNNAGQGVLELAIRQGHVGLVCTALRTELPMVSQTSGLTQTAFDNIITDFDRNDERELIICTLLFYAAKQQGLPLDAFHSVFSLVEVSQLETDQHLGLYYYAETAKEIRRQVQTPAVAELIEAYANTHEVDWDSVFSKSEKTTIVAYAQLYEELTETHGTELLPPSVIDSGLIPNEGQVLELRSLKQKMSNFPFFYTPNNTDTQDVGADIAYGVSNNAGI